MSVAPIFIESYERVYHGKIEGVTHRMIFHRYLLHISYDGDPFYAGPVATVRQMRQADGAPCVGAACSPSPGTR